jgi:hypothetical protein
MGSAPQNHELEVGKEIVHEDVLEVGSSSPQAKRKNHPESSTQGGSQPQVEGTLVLPNILKGVHVDDDMVGAVNSIKYFYHEVVYVAKFPDLTPQIYLESRGEGSSGMPLLEPTQWILGLYNIGIMNLLDVPHFG